MSGKAKTVALIVAAGSGSRAGGEVPKQFREIAGKSVVAHAFDSLAAHPAISDTPIVIGEGQQKLLEAALAGRSARPVTGGAERQQSVHNGLEAIVATGGADIVLIHDAARMAVPADVTDRLLAACETHDGAIPVLPVTDSLVHRDRGNVRREEFAVVQTPQAFRFDAILAAHRNWSEDRCATDDAEIARVAGHDIALVEGDAALKKLTFAEDFAMHSPSPAPIRTGFGYDVHAFTEGDHVRLGGVQIAHDRGLAGHSDADVALHALTDAILGALGEGDIGSHFPPSDPQWKGAASHLFLEHARDLAAGASYAISHIDVTIICEAPKIGPHRDAMRAAIARMLAIPENSVSIKATTTEKLGFTGRREGIAAQAVATLWQGS